MATSLVTIIEITILVAVLQTKRFKLSGSKFMRHLLPVAVVGGLTFVLALFIHNLNLITAADNLFILIVKLGLVSSLIGLGYLGLSYIFRIKEVFLLARYVKNVVRRLSTTFYEKNN